MMRLEANKKSTWQYEQNSATLLSKEFHFQAYYLEKSQMGTKKVCTKMSKVALFIMAKDWKHSECL